MITEITNHKTEYTILFTYTVLSLIFFFGFSQNSQRFTIIALYGAFYFCWSIIHHLINKTLTTMVVLEYLLITSLALVCLKVVFFPQL